MDFKELLAYKKAFSLAMEIYQVSKEFPEEEKDSLIIPIRNSSRKACYNIAESFSERELPECYLNRLINSDGQINATLVLLQFARACKYIEPDLHEKLELQTEEVSIMINYMINNPDKFGSRHPS